MEISLYYSHFVEKMSIYYVAYNMQLSLYKLQIYILNANNIASQFPRVHLNPYKLIIIVIVLMRLGKAQGTSKL